MAGNKIGAQKARETNLQKDPDFYRNIGKKSWQDSSRNRKTGFAAMDKETHRQLSQRGGKKTKNDYKTTQRSAQVGDRFQVNGEEYEVALVEEIEFETAESLHEIFAQDQDSDGPSLSE